MRRSFLYCLLFEINYKKNPMNKKLSLVSSIIYFSLNIVAQTPVNWSYTSDFNTLFTGQQGPSLITGNYQSANSPENGTTCNYFNVWYHNFAEPNVASSLALGSDNSLYSRLYWYGNWTSWNKYWHSGNLNRSDVDFNAKNIYAHGNLMIAGVYNFEQVKLGQYGNGACGLELINHSGVSTSYGVRLRTNIDEGIIGLQVQTAPSASDLSNLNYVTRLTVLENGRIGIGTTYPSGILQINADAPYVYLTSTSADAPNAAIRGNAGTWLFGYGGASGNEDISVGTQDGSGQRTLTFAAGGSAKMKILANGNVSIGTMDAGNYKLNVAGRLRAEEIVVNTTGADFVFEPSYKLRSLIELETFIKQNKHLPDITPASEMQTNGVNMGDMQTKLLQKQEETVLYLIEQERKNSALEEKIDRLENENSELKQEMKELKELIMRKQIN